MKSRQTKSNIVLPLAIGFAFVISLLSASSALAQCGGSGKKEAKGTQSTCAKTKPKTCEQNTLKPQTVCPIMGGKINKSVYIDVAGYRFYACCPPCLDKIKADPAKALATLKEKGETPEVRLTVCPKCGEIKGTKKCCKTGIEKCSACGLHKGSIGCCKHLKPVDATKGVAVCCGCGEIKGSAACCKPSEKKCGCGMHKGSIGCCKNLKPADGEKDVRICLSCGEVKGSKKCCSKDAKACAKCGLHSGSPGCCKLDQITKDIKDVVLCSACGQVKGSDACCKPDAKKCSKCGLAKGSPGCCKLKEFVGGA